MSRKFITMQHSIAPIPEEARLETRFYQMFFVWFSASMNILTYVLTFYGCIESVGNEWSVFTVSAPEQLDRRFSTLEYAILFSLSSWSTSCRASAMSPLLSAYLMFLLDAVWFQHFRTF